MTSGLTDREVIRVVKRYIGVSGGYLGMPEPFTDMEGVVKGDEEGGAVQVK